MRRDVMSLDASLTRPWPARRFAQLAISLAGAFLTVCVTANLLIDPYGVFGTRLLPSHISTNYRHFTYARYLRERATIDTIVLGSSRVGLAFDPATVEAALPGRRVAQFWAQAGTVSDALPIVRAVMRDRERGLTRVDTAILVLDLQLLGTNVSPFGRFTRHHPAVTGESSALYYISYLFHLDYNQMLRKLRHSRTIGARDINLFRDTVPPGQPYILDAHPPPVEQADIMARPDTERHLAELGELVAFARARGLRLEIILPPIAPDDLRRIDPPSLSAAVARIRRLTPVWSFDLPAWLAGDPSLWLDLNHYSPRIAAMMLARVFGTDRAPAPTGFGVPLAQVTPAAGG